jgi:hypothetical protein
MQSDPEAMNKDVSGSGSSSGSVRQAFGFDGKNGESPAASQGQRNEVLPAFTFFHILDIDQATLPHFSSWTKQLTPIKCC